MPGVNCACTGWAAVSPCPGSGGEAAPHHTHTTAPQAVAWPSPSNVSPLVAGMLRARVSPKQGRNPPALGGAAPELHVPAPVPLESQES